MTKDLIKLKSQIEATALEFISLSNENEKLRRKMRLNVKRGEKLTEILEQLQERYVSSVPDTASSLDPKGEYLESLQDEGVSLSHELDDDEGHIISDGRAHIILKKAWKYFITGA